MPNNKHKRKENHVIIVTSDAVDANVKQIRIKPWVLKTGIFVLCLLLGTMLGYIIFEQQIWSGVAQKYTAQSEEMQVLKDRNAELSDEVEQLNTQIHAMNEKIAVLSTTVNQKTEIENQLSAALAQHSNPTEFPLNSSAVMEENADGTPSCIFSATSGSMVIATANGTVMAVNDEAEYGHNVWIDHGNGYITVYRNQGEPMVQQGQVVSRGAVLFLIGDKNQKFCYQMLKDGTHINPVEMLKING
ncbi:MAG: peptidoglycan DD-metalloendopeptidase family protein [Lachnospiraceae bacterium]|nr:peptidoglycan DD-metalloendopeptidase family protein [Lachnospiraceae bacterium]